MGLRLVGKALRRVGTGLRLVREALLLFRTGPRLVQKALRRTFLLPQTRDAVLECLEAGHGRQVVRQGIQVAMKGFNDAVPGFNVFLSRFQVAVLCTQVGVTSFQVGPCSFHVAVPNRWVLGRFVLFRDSWMRLRGYNGVEPRMKHGWNTDG